MTAYQTHEGMYDFKYLPAFAKFLLQNHLEQFAKEQLELSYQLQLPIMKIFAHMSAEQVLAVSIKNISELLTVIADNKVKQHLEESLHKWANNQHEMVNRFDLVAEDITLINYVRQKGFKKWMLAYTTKSEELVGLNNEIDDYSFANNTSGTNTYIKILIQNLEKNRNQLLEAQSIAQVGSFEWDFVNVSRDNSPEMRKIFETEEAQSYEQMLSKVHPNDREKLTNGVAEAVEKGQSDFEYRYVIDKKEKVLWTKAVVHYDNGKAVLMSGTVQDVTERKKIEQALLEKAFELEVSNANLEKFAYVASHDLQEPLRKILMHTDLLQQTEKDRLSEAGKGLFEKIINSTQKMKLLIRDILTYSTLNPGKDKEKVQLEDLLKEVTAELEFLITKKQAKIQSDQLPAACVFPSQLKQLFQNLISNSIKFSKKDTRPFITITHRLLSLKQVNGKKVAPAKSYLQLQFIDNGIGFEMEKSQEIFSLFKRLHSQKEFEGSGLGLAICKKVAENHGGSIEATAVKNEGSKFTIILPQ